MKRLLMCFCMFALIITCTWASQKGNKVINVSTAEEFLKAIGDNREIVITAEDGILLTPALEKMIANKEIRKYDSVTKAPQTGVFYENETDGPTIVISGLRDITIRSNVKGVRRSVEVTPRYAFVLNFVCCQNIQMDDLLLGHTKEGYCSNGVLGFDACKNVMINNCGLFGCGTEGIVARQVQNLQVDKSEIFDCSYSILHLFGCNIASFTNCYFYNNKEYDLIGFGDSENIVFYNCTFAGNQGTLFNVIDSHVQLTRCLISHKGDNGDVNKLDCQDCIWINK